ncbi:ribonuclease P complex subunit Pop1 [Trichophyton tonsurans CBS 112818]|uniref:Ribonuclease P complex subunit Pop1 n=2 Tax=Trichophyton TaxID=5550 RepID=F2PX32_TRIEC|nr:ribonuclease P complex subunit Pop1 [Trichophyton tonsurans CBS 112818]EGE06450.1 ribonuclease P complex subunit Pop1 [Trichophyton equinum CBS 127.97]
MASNGPNKRKGAWDSSSSLHRKRVKIQDARTLAVQSSDTALSKTGELDVAAFVAARQFEIRALEAGIRKSKNAATTRAFQQVPKSLRRRTASHNVKRVPRRLRAREKREMIEDNTPTVTARRRKPTQLMRLRLESARRLQSLNARSKAKRQAVAKAKLAQSPHYAGHDFEVAPRIPKIKKNKLSHPQKPASKFRKRQICKTWLPTHMFHAKRAHLTEPKNSLWRFAIPLTPTEKCYRTTHRANGARGAIAWDMSYMSTIGLEGTYTSLESLLRALGVNGQNAWGANEYKWRNGTRSLRVWVYERDGQKRPIAPVQLIWCPRKQDEDIEMTDAGSVPKKLQKSKTLRRRMFLRVHPSAFLQLWDELLKVAKIQKPQVMVEDLRFEIGSIEVAGPGSTEALLGALKPTLPHGVDIWPEGSPESTWLSLAGLTNSASLPRNALLSFNISDPRLRFPPKTIKIPNSEESHTELMETLASWKPDSTQKLPSDLFSQPARRKACWQLPSQKAINRRKSEASPGEDVPPKSSDPNIPIILLASNNTSGNSNSQGSWTVLLPWKCVTPVWYYLLYYPLSSGGNPRFGGIQEQQQLAFESKKPWFPGDFPGTRAGWEWEIRERKREKEAWERKPKAKRVEYNSVNLGIGKIGEIGQGWACDWERLLLGPASMALNHGVGPGERRNQPDQSKTAEADLIMPLDLIQLDPFVASAIISNLEKSNHLPASLESLCQKPALATVAITLLNRGTPMRCSRIYRLPTSDLELRSKCLSLLNQLKEPSRKTGNNSKEQAHLPIPQEEDLLGFVTSGNFNLAAGKGTGIGAILVNRICPHRTLDEPSAPSTSKNCHQEVKLMNICIIRAAGENVGRLGRWEVA